MAIRRDQIRGDGIKRPSYEQNTRVMSVFKDIVTGHIFYKEEYFHLN